MSIELKSVCRLVLFKECKVMITIPKRYNIILFKSFCILFELFDIKWISPICPSHTISKICKSHSVANIRNVFFSDL